MKYRDCCADLYGVPLGPSSYHVSNRYTRCLINSGDSTIVTIAWWWLYEEMMMIAWTQRWRWDNGDNAMLYFVILSSCYPYDVIVIVQTRRRWRHDKMITRWLQHTSTIALWLLQGDCTLNLYCHLAITISHRYTNIVLYCYNNRVIIALHVLFWQRDSMYWS